MSDLHDQRVRLAAFEWLQRQVDLLGDVLSSQVLRQAFTCDNTRVALLGPQGIFKPRILDLPLSITTAPDGPYDDTFGPDGLLQYRYRGADPIHRDNVGLRELMRQRLPLIYLHGVAKGKYMAALPRP